MKKFILTFCMLFMANGFVNAGSLDLDSLIVKAKSGDAKSQNLLGAFYYEKKDYEKAYYWFKKATEQADGYAYYNLGQCYLYGRGIQRDTVQAMFWLKKAAEKELNVAYRLLGLCYLKGDGVPCDTIQAMSWFKKGAEKGDSECQDFLAEGYEYGCGIIQDDFKAIYWYQKAALQGWFWSGRKLVEMFERIAKSNNSKKTEYALSCMKEAAENGDVYEFQRALGIAYARGEGVVQDGKQADYWFGKIKEAYRIEEIGDLYEKGDEVPKDINKSLYWFTKAANQGNADSMKKLGLHYKKTDKAKSAYWFLKAAEKGNASAQNSIGCAYYNGEGVLQDYSQAFYWYQEAAKQHNTNAERNLKLFSKLSENLYRVGTKGNYALISNNRKVLLPPKYNAIGLMADNLIKFEDKSGYWGVVNNNGIVLIPTTRQYLSIGNYDNSTKSFSFTKKGYKGYCNSGGKELSIIKILPTIDEIKTRGSYSSIVKLLNGKANFYKVSKGGLYGLTDEEGKEVVPCEMTALESAGTGYLRYKLNGFWGLMNYQGKILIDTDRGYTSIGDYKSFNKRFSYTMNGYKGECNSLGQQISKIKVATQNPSTSVASSSSSSSSSSRTSSSSSSTSSTASSSSSGSSNSGNSTTTIHVEHHRDPVPMQQWQACFACGGMGTMGCDFCGGSGTKYIGDRLHRCSRCNGRGIIPCNVCYGNKGQYVTVYK